jgi:hypothetical protein
MAQDVPRSSTYYAKGSEEVASETALTLKKLETVSLSYQSNRHRRMYLSLVGCTKFKPLGTKCETQIVTNSSLTRVSLFANLPFLPPSKATEFDSRFGTSCHCPRRSTAGSWQVLHIAQASQFSQLEWLPMPNLQCRQIPSRSIRSHCPRG